MDHAVVSRALRDLAQQLTTAEQTHSLVEAARAYERDRVVPGLLKPRSIQAYRVGLREVVTRWGDLPLSTDWEREAADLVSLRGVSAWRTLQVLRSVLTHAQRLGWREDAHGLGSVLRRCRYAHRDESYTDEQVRALLAALDELDRTHPITVPAREVIRGLAYTGCRASEIASLRSEDWRGDHLRLRDSKTGPRSIPLCGPAQLLLGRQRQRNGWLFPGRLAGHVSIRHCQVVFAEALQAAGLRYGTLHTLRHSWATIAMRNGVPAAVAQAVLGHSTAWMHARYVHAQKHDLRLGCAVVANAITGGTDR